MRSGALQTLYPGVRGAGVLLCPVRRPSCASVKVHVVGGGFQSVRLRAVVGRGRVGDDFVQVRVIVAVGLLQVHSVRIVAPPARLLCIIHRLQGKETRQRLSTDSHLSVQAQQTHHLYLSKFYAENAFQCIMGTYF